MNDQQNCSDDNTSNYMYFTLIIIIKSPYWIFNVCLNYDKFFKILLPNISSLTHLCYWEHFEQTDQLAD